MRHRRGKKSDVNMETYNRSRPHQALFNFTPAHVHEVNNKTALLLELTELKRRTRDRRKDYWAERSRRPMEGGGMSR
jgi:hypothetical protein